MPIENSYNDTPSSALPISFNSTYLCDFSSTSDIDYFSFKTSGNSSVSISIYPSYLGKWDANPIILSTYSKQSPYTAIESFYVVGSAINEPLEKIYPKSEYLIKFERSDRFAYNEFGADYDLKIYETVPSSSWSDTTATTSLDRIFNWAENTYRFLFPEHQTTFDFGTLDIRIYSNGNALEGLMDNIYYYNGANDDLIFVGTINDYLPSAITAGF